MANYPTPIFLKTICGYTSVFCKSEDNNLVHVHYFDQFGQPIKNWLSIPPDTAVEIVKWMENFCKENNYILYSY